MANRSGPLAIVTLVIGLGVGAASGYLLGASQSRETAAPASDAASPPSAPRDPPPEIGAAEPARRAPRTRAGADDRFDLSALGADAPSVAAGDGRIAGVVTSATGAPVAGVLVRATPAESDDDEDDEDVTGHAPGGPPPRADIEREARKFVRRLRRTEAATREATTDAAGAYTLTGLAAGRQHVEAWLAGHRVERTGGDSWRPVPIGGTCDFRATAIQRVTVAVLLPDGTAPEAALVSWKAVVGGDETESSWTPGSAEMEVPPGTYTFTAHSDPADLFSSPPQTVTIAAGVPQTVTLRVATRPGIRVRITYASANRPRDVRVAAVRLDGGTAADPRRLLGAPHAEWLESDATECALADLPPGPYLVGLTFRGGFIGATAPVTVGAELANIDLRVEDADVRDSVRLWVRGPDGEPVRDAAIVCGCRSAEGSGYTEANIECDSDGSYRVPHYETGAPGLGNRSGTSNHGPGGAKRTYYVQAKSPEHGADEAVYDPAADREVTIRLAAPARLVVTIGGYAQYAERERLGLQLRGTGATGRRNSDDFRDDPIRIDAAGVSELGPLKPGTYEVTLSLAKTAEPGSGRNRRHDSWDNVEIARTAVTLTAGENAITLAVAAVTDLVVALEPADASKRVRLERTGADGSRQTVRGGERREDSNEITFPSLASGRYRLISDEGDMFVSVPDERRVTFRPRPFNAYTLVVGEKCYLAELGLRTGDLVVGIDGADFRDRLAMDAALAAAKTRESSKFSIVRGGQRFEVAADGKRFEEDEGSTYAPWVR